MSFILWSMGLVLSIFVGVLAWKIALLGFLLVVKIVLDHPRKVFGTIGVLAAIAIGLFAWGIHHDTEVNRKAMEMTTSVSSPSPTPKGFSPQTQKVLNDFLEEKKREYQAEHPEPAAGVDELVVPSPTPDYQAQYNAWAARQKKIKVKRAELVKK